MKILPWTLILIGLLFWAGDVGFVAGADHHGSEHTQHAMDAHGEHDAAHGDSHDEQPGLLTPDLGTAVWTIVLFLALFAVLAKFVWPPILKGLQAREDKIKSDLEQAEQAAADATAKMEQYQAKLTEAQKEAQQVIEQSRQDAQRVAAQLKDQARGEITQLKDRAASEINIAKQQAITELYGQAAVLATQVAGKILQREIRPEDHQSLIDQSLQQMGRLKDN